MLHASKRNESAAHATINSEAQRNAPASDAIMRPEEARLEKAVTRLETRPAAPSARKLAEVQASTCQV